MGLAPKCYFVLGLPNWSPEIPEMRIPATMEAHNFMCKLLIEMRFKAKLSLLKMFER